MSKVEQDAKLNVNEAESAEKVSDKVHDTFLFTSESVGDGHPGE